MARLCDTCEFDENGSCHSHWACIDYELWTEKSSIARERLDKATKRVQECESLLKSIGELAHANSQGPAVHDILWTIRNMAFEVERTRDG